MSHNFWNQGPVLLQTLAEADKTLSASAKRKLSEFQLLAWKLTTFLMWFFEPRVSFPLRFAPPVTVMIENFSEVFKLNYYALDKRAHQSTNFDIFACFNESSPNSSWEFWNHKVKIYLNFASLFSVMKDNSVFFLAEIFILWTKSNFQIFEWLGEHSPNSFCHVWNCKSVFL